MAFACAERSGFGVGPPAVPSRIRRVREDVVGETASASGLTAAAPSAKPAAQSQWRRAGSKERNRLVRGSWATGMPDYAALSAGGKALSGRD